MKIYILECKLIMEDWRQEGKSESIYDTELGIDLSMGELHSGTTFNARVEISADVAQEIENSYKEHGCYPVLRLIPNMNNVL